MSWLIIRALVRKDLTLFLRNRFFAFIAILGLVAYIGIYFVMPDMIDEKLELALYAETVPPVFEMAEHQGIVAELLESEDAVKEAVTNGEVVAGIVLPDDFLDRLRAGDGARLDLYFTSDAPSDLKDSVTTLLRELSYLQSGEQPAVVISQQILGTDMVGTQIPTRDRMLPLFAVLVILMETLGLASLISEEIESGTVRALLATPMTVGGLFAAKAITGVTLAFTQALLLLAITGGMAQQPLLIVTVLLLAAFLVTGVGFLIAARGRDLMSVMAYGMPAILILSVPSFGVLFPGAIAGWVKVIPSYYLVDVVNQTVNYGAGWGDAWLNLLILLGFDIAIVTLGIITLRRRLR